MTKKDTHRHDPLWMQALGFKPCPVGKIYPAQWHHTELRFNIHDSKSMVEIVTTLRRYIEKKERRAAEDRLRDALFTLMGLSVESLDEGDRAGVVTVQE